ASDPALRRDGRVRLRAEDRTLSCPCLGKPARLHRFSLSRRCRNPGDQSMTRSLLLPGLAFACALGFASVAPAEVAPASMGADARVRSVLYNPVDVIRLDTHLRVNTAIELGAGERIDSVLLGDSEAFEVEVLSNRTTVSVKPLIAGAETNMTIYTGPRTISLSISEG